MAEDSDATARPRYTDRPETPTGIWIIAVLGLIGAVLSLLTGLSALATGDLGVLIGAVLIAVALAQGITMLALVGLTPWSWYATVGLYSVAAVLNFTQGRGVGMLVAAVIALYVAVHKDLFVGE